ncbi:tRNA (adenosine(37)-N6)-threonylcarbamoyltransferase complex dimerization subunit type 1 TsaB [Flavobacterium rhizosphaerae]|uniref:tRNA (Adenosine(37)-N6)-threonylcarbamoyltransferase complex dimerization subunit type 1 TsaB n=1 Tax=Flavobacterium rhizosphaerae TaxID=3163298 RepID=A0ABW8YV51_9FLAO
MAYILTIETATKNCSVALAKDNTTIALKEFAGEGYAHAEKLHVFIDEIINAAGISYTTLDAVAVSMGPGSYTGLRIGVSAAKGLCYALEIPLIALDTLEILARAVSIESGIIIPMIDARRMEVYSALFTPQYKKIGDTQAEVLTESSYNHIEEPLHLCGDGAAKFAGIATNANVCLHQDIIYPSAAQMAQMAFDKYKISDIVDVAYFEPYYLKDFIAGKKQL